GHRREPLVPVAREEGLGVELENGTALAAPRHAEGEPRERRVPERAADVDRREVTGDLPELEASSELPPPVKTGRLRGARDRTAEREVEATMPRAVLAFAPLERRETEWIYRPLPAVDPVLGVVDRVDASEDPRERASAPAPAASEVTAELVPTLTDGH